MSIVVNNFNYGRYVATAIDSALGQSYEDVEVIVVDDGSTDDSRQRIATFGTRVVTVLKENGGQGSAFNAGFTQSTGAIVIFLDSDDFLYPDAVASIVAAWRPDLSKVHYRLDVVDADGTPTGASNPSRWWPLARGDIWRDFLRQARFITPSTSGNAFTRETLGEILPMPEEEYAINADGYVVNRTVFRGPVAAIERALGAYRVHGQNAWASGTAPAQLHKAVQYDQRRYRVLEAEAAHHGVHVPAGLQWRDFVHLRDRLIAFRLAPDGYPIHGERRRTLVWHGLRSVWRPMSATFGALHRVAFTLWFLWAGLAPLPLARRALLWAYAPAARPRWFRGLLPRRLPHTSPMDAGAPGGPRPSGR